MIARSYKSRLPKLFNPVPISLHVSLELSIKSLSDLLEALTLEVPYQQQLFNHQFIDLCEEFLPVIEAAKLLGLESLALSVFPRPCVLSSVEIDVRFHAATSSEGAMALQVKPLNLGFSRRFAHSGFVENRLHAVVQKIAPEPQK